MIGGRIVPRFQELTPDKLGKVKISVVLGTSVLVADFSFFFSHLLLPSKLGWIGAREILWNNQGSNAVH